MRLSLWCRLFHRRRSPVVHVEYYSPAGAFIRVITCLVCGKQVRKAA